MEELSQASGAHAADRTFLTPVFSRTAINRLLTVLPELERPADRAILHVEPPAHDWLSEKRIIDGTKRQHEAVSLLLPLIKAATWRATDKGLAHLPSTLVDEVVGRLRERQISSKIKPADLLAPSTCLVSAYLDSSVPRLPDRRVYARFFAKRQDD
jgi:hypothetical protein